MADAGFKIDGVVYEMPLPSTFDIDEAEIYFKYTGVVLEEIWLENIGWDELKTRPGFVPAFAHVAYRRAHPGTGYDDVRVVVGRQNRYELVGSWIASLADEDESSEDPKAPTTADLTRPSPTSSETDLKPGRTSWLPESSGQDSTMRSAPLDGEPESTGTSASGSDQVSVPLRQVV